MCISSLFWSCTLNPIYRDSFIVKDTLWSIKISEFTKCVFLCNCLAIGLPWASFAQPWCTCSWASSRTYTTPSIETDISFGVQREKRRVEWIGSLVVQFSTFNSMRQDLGISFVCACLIHFVRICFNHHAYI